MRLFGDLLAAVLVLALVAVFVSSNAKTANALQNLLGGLASWIGKASSR